LSIFRKPGDIDSWLLLNVNRKSQVAYNLPWS